MNKLISYLIFLVFSFSFSVGAQEKKRSAAELLKTLHSDSTIRVLFTEKVKVPFLKRALVSQGQFVIHPSGKFIREILSPTQSLTLFSGDAIVVTDKSGTMRIEKSSAPDIIGAMTLLRDLTQANSASLEERYLVSVEGEGENWAVVLKSRKEKSIFKQCIIHGKKDVILDLSLIESDGVKREIIFKSIDIQTDLSKKENRLFKP